MERPAEDIFKVQDLDGLRSPLPKHLFKRTSLTGDNFQPFTMMALSPSGATVGSAGDKENYLGTIAKSLQPPVPAFNSPTAAVANGKVTSPPTGSRNIGIFDPPIPRPTPIYAIPGSSPFTPASPTTLNLPPDSPSPKIVPPVNPNSSKVITPGKPLSCDPKKFSPKRSENDFPLSPLEKKLLQTMTNETMKVPFSVFTPPEKPVLLIPQQSSTATFPAIISPPVEEKLDQLKLSSQPQVFPSTNVEKSAISENNLPLQPPRESTIRVKESRKQSPKRQEQSIRISKRNNAKDLAAKTLL